MNKITATGRLAADAELRFTAGGDPILGFRLASDVGFGEKKITNWFACSLFGKRAEGLQPHLTKGQQVTVFGTLALREWTGKDGAKQLSPDIRIDEIVLQGGKREPREDGYEDTPAVRKQAQQYSTPDKFVETDIPF